MAKIVGAGKHSRRLGKIARDTANEVAKKLYIIGQQVELDAELSITAGSISGKNHVASAPGEPPNADTRHLDSNIETRLEKSSFLPRVSVESNAEYSAALEYGTEKMAARPFMRPALEKNRPAIVKAAGMGVNTALRKSGG